ncbi:MAG: hypothetical protein JXX29_13890 [Deltaproteobacteria bacterium]|nr:hypothetical protein [Deltaproteobacteria bacterium]MBN2672768.1 hypothetical protein [Deltaproteobacteria bacterium]
MSHQLSPRIVRGTVSFFLFVGLAVGVISVRLFIDGRTYLNEAEQLRASSAPWRNVVSRYEDAAKTYFPGNPFPERALWQLSILAKSAGMRGETKRERYIWEVIRRSAVSQRHFFQPFSGYVDEARRVLARTSELPAKESSAADGPADGLADPGIGATLLMTFGLLLWIGAAIGSIFVAPPKMFFYMGGSTLGMILWAVAAWVA